MFFSTTFRAMKVARDCQGAVGYISGLRAENWKDSALRVEPRPRHSQFLTLPRAINFNAALSLRLFSSRSFSAGSIPRLLISRKKKKTFRTPETPAHVLRMKERFLLKKKVALLPPHVLLCVRTYVSRKRGSDVLFRLFGNACSATLISTAVSGSPLFLRGEYRADGRGI